MTRETGFVFSMYLQAAGERSGWVSECAGGRRHARCVIVGGRRSERERVLANASVNQALSHV